MLHFWLIAKRGAFLPNCSFVCVCVCFNREDYTRLFEFVSEKNLRVTNKGKVPQQKVSYNDDMSSESDHDAYLERMKAEGEERDSEDGTLLSRSLSHPILFPSF